MLKLMPDLMGRRASSHHLPITIWYTHHQSHASSAYFPHVPRYHPRALCPCTPCRRGWVPPQNCYPHRCSTTIPGMGSTVTAVWPAGICKWTRGPLLQQWNARASAQTSLSWCGAQPEPLATCRDGPTPLPVALFSPLQLTETGPCFLLIGV